MTVVRARLDSFKHESSRKMVRYGARTVMYGLKLYGRSGEGKGPIVLVNDHTLLVGRAPIAPHTPPFESQSVPETQLV